MFHMELSRPRDAEHDGFTWNIRVQSRFCAPELLNRRDQYDQL